MLEGASTSEVVTLRMPTGAIVQVTKEIWVVVGAERPARTTSVPACLGGIIGAIALRSEGTPQQECDGHETENCE